MKPMTGGNGHPAGGPASLRAIDAGGSSGTEPVALPGVASATASPLGRQDPTVDVPQTHVEISGRLLQARVTMRDQQHGDLTEVTVIDNVKAARDPDGPARRSAAVGHRPMAARHGGQLAAGQGSTVKGEPAHMEGRGMSLTGPNIHIDRGANLLRMEGPGRMEKFLDHDLENRPLKPTGTR